ncbi:hypothetical protein OEZ85_000676 [Tetradesmus obliquus]|uniref:Collagen-like protein n=1 Tax=Tetradesmus obliquus TaxID=3088 RepID=A0ABY8UKA0_TETOB|nr:hypothetical protein OEZ85_000676 [Tetradesmus obliquus]
MFASTINTQLSCKRAGFYWHGNYCSPCPANYYWEDAAGACAPRQAVECLEQDGCKPLNNGKKELTECAIEPEPPSCCPNATGLPGPQGIQGPQGVGGLAGAPGRNGTGGVDGSDGRNGLRGPAGPTGPPGAVGAPGQQGKDGSDGAVGPAGPQGPAGQSVPGPTGPIGVAGPQGPAGQDTPGVGITGPTGPPGVGPTGPQGLFGPRGADGAAGAPGPDGPDGKNGNSGPRGVGAMQACTNVEFRPVNPTAPNLWVIGFDGATPSIGDTSGDLWFDCSSTGAPAAQVYGGMCYMVVLTKKPGAPARAGMPVAVAVLRQQGASQNMQ